ncbi:ABC transporter permease subunit [Hymenobacter caeli]|uniref:Spermidine/putrescine transport system permease protein n=1 Tax=Hymenobacter caeli TaxID=2735894 RepID=A0ABX2FV46_9BACT|nr:ABC transporter permease subunit [Hymenobacter caeli]NRT20297.1 putative spermidine/putrescine transport system permease protein [Hymenobacter caeli]
MLSKPRSSKLLLGLYGLLVAGLPLAGLCYALLGSLGLVGPLAAGFTGRYWRALGTDTGLLQAALFSLWVAGASLALAGGLALALVLGAQATLRRRPLPTLLYVPLLMPALVMGFYLFQLLSGAGWLSRLSFGLGLTPGVEGFPELVQDAAGVGIIMAHVLLLFPFFTLLFQAIYQESRLADYYQLAQTLGARPGQFRWRVAVPVLLRRAAPTLLLSGIATLGAYDIPLLLGRPYPQMLSVYIATRLQRFDLRELPAAYLAGFLVAVGLLGLILVLTRLTRRHAL